jgi:ribosome recycling factor
MKALQDWDRKELTEKVYEIIVKANIELGHKSSGKDMAVWAKSLTEDLQEEVRFKRLYLFDVAKAFKNGVRMDVEKQFLSIPTFWKWLRAQKKLIDNDIYKVRTLNVPKEKAPLYREMPKLLK